MRRPDLLHWGAALMCLTYVSQVDIARAGVYSKPDVRATIVSRQSEKAGGELADRDVEALDLSANGRYVAFETQARNLGGAAGPGTRIYRYDTLKNRVLLVSRTRSGALDRASRAPSISANGRYVAFSSNADRWIRSYVFDAKRKRLDLVSRQSRVDGNRPADRDSFISDISPDGRSVAFGSLANNLGGPGGARASLYVRDLVSGETELIAKQGYSGTRCCHGAGATSPSPAGRRPPTTSFAPMSTTAINARLSP